MLKVTIGKTMNRRKFLGVTIASGFGIGLIYKALKARQKPKYDVGEVRYERTWNPDTDETGHIIHPPEYINHLNIDKGGYIGTDSKGKDIVLRDGKGNAISVDELVKLRDE